MTLKEIIRAIELVAAKQPAVSTIVRDNIFKLNERADVKYGVFAWTQGQHGESVTSDVQIFRFTFFYVDRLVFNGRNGIECQSVGIDTLGNIIRELAEDFSIGEWTVETFTQRFADSCAGAYTTITLRSVRGTSCPEIFPTRYAGDYNEDYNDDFLHWSEKNVQLI